MQKSNKRKNENSSSKSKHFAPDDDLEDDLTYFLINNRSQSKPKKSSSKQINTPIAKSQSSPLNSIKTTASTVDLNKTDISHTSTTKTMASIDSIMIKSRDLEIKQIKDNLANLGKQFKVSQKTNDEKFEILSESSNRILEVMKSVQTSIASMQNNKHLLMSETPALATVELYPNSQVQIKQSTLDLARSGKSATIFMLTILPGLCKVADVYRTTLSGTAPRVGEERKALYIKKKKFDGDLRNVLHFAAKHYKADSYSKQVLNTSLANHLRNLTNLFIALRDGHLFNDSLLKDHHMTATHLKFRDMIAYIKNPSKFIELDCSIDGHKDVALGNLNEISNLINEQAVDEQNEKELSENDESAVSSEEDYECVNESDEISCGDEDSNEPIEDD